VIAVAAVAVAVFATMLGCSDARQLEITKITFAGKALKIEGFVSCARQLDGC